MSTINYKEQALDMLAKLEGESRIKMIYGFVSTLYKNEQEENHDRTGK